MQVVVVQGSHPAFSSDISSLLSRSPLGLSDFSAEQKKDPQVQIMLDYLERASLPDDKKLTCKTATQVPIYAVASGILCYIDSKRRKYKCVVIPPKL